MSGEFPSAFLFPDPALADKEGLLCFGGDLEPSTLLAAYSQGIFPWFNAGDPILWWSPHPRFLLFPSELQFSRRTQKRLEQCAFEVRADERFKEVIGGCQKAVRKNQEGTWILPKIVKAYERLFEEGYAHSLEVYKEGELVGGLYGVSLGAAFFGESMFSRQDHASKAALRELCRLGVERGWKMIDCQIHSEHLERWGARAVDRERFLILLKEALKEKTWRGRWSLN